MADRLRPAECACGEMVIKREIPSRLGGFVGAGDWDSAHYNAALGKGFRNNLDARRYAKANGLTEVGNEDPVKVGDSYERDRKKRLDYDISSITNLGELRSG